MAGCCCSLVAKWKNVNNAIKWSKFCWIIYQSRKDFPFNEEDYYYSSFELLPSSLELQCAKSIPYHQSPTKKSPLKKLQLPLIFPDIPCTEFYTTPEKLDVTEPSYLPHKSFS